MSKFERRINNAIQYICDGQLEENSLEIEDILDESKKHVYYNIPMYILHILLFLYDCDSKLKIKNFNNAKETVEKYLAILESEDEFNRYSNHRLHDLDC